MMKENKLDGVLLVINLEGKNTFLDHTATHLYYSGSIYHFCRSPGAKIHFFKEKLKSKKSLFR